MRMRVTMLLDLRISQIVRLRAAMRVRHDNWVSDRGGGQLDAVDGSVAGALPKQCASWCESVSFIRGKVQAKRCRREEESESSSVMPMDCRNQTANVMVLSMANDGA